MEKQSLLKTKAVPSSQKTSLLTKAKSSKTIEEKKVAIIKDQKPKPIMPLKSKEN